MNTLLKDIEQADMAAELQAIADRPSIRDLRKAGR